MRLRSRLSGQVEAVSPPLVPDLFQLADGAKDRVVADGLPAEFSPTFLLKRPSEREIQAVCAVADELKGEARWELYAQALPLTPRIDERARLLPLDRELLTHLSHLAHVCHQPRLHLRTEEERVPVGRARRVPARAIAALLSRPGDWEHRTLRGIQPSHVLTVQSEDEWDLYENRVAVRLVDHLLAYITERLEELRDIAQMFAKMRDFQSAVSGSHWRASRIYRLWGELFKADADRREREEALQALTMAERTLQGLLGAPLYAQIPRQRTVPLALRPTNILVNDMHYRKVAHLWRTWVKAAHRPQLSRSALRAQRQAECCSFDRFAALITVRALADLGYQALDDAQPLHIGNPVDLLGPTGSATLCVAADGTLTFSVQQQRLRVIPLLVSIPSDATIAELLLSALGEAEGAGARNRLDQTLILLLGRPEEVRRLPPALGRVLAGLAASGIPGGRRVLAVSPWILDNVERVARSLRGFEATARATAYPPVVEISPDPGVPLPGWMRRAGRQVAAVAEPRSQESTALMDACDRRLAQLSDEQAAAQRTRRAFDPGQMQGVKRLRHLIDSAGALAGIATCPVCGADANPIEPRHSSTQESTTWTYFCECASCHTEWGLWTCGSCQDTFPVLLPSGIKPEYAEKADPELPATPDNEWLDRTYGRDLFAEPCRYSARTFRCTRCGSCPGGGCARCIPSNTPALS